MRTAILTTILSIVSTSNLCAQISVAWKLKEGERFYVEETHDVRQTLRIKDDATLQSVQITKVSRFDVVQKDKDSNFVLSKTIDTIRMKYKGGSKRVDDRVVKALEGARFTLTISPSGQIKTYAGFDAFLKHLQDTGRKHLVPLIEAGFSESDMQSADERIFGVGADKLVSPGARWSRKRLEPFGPLGGLQLQTLYTLQEKQQVDGTVKIGMTSTISYRRPTKKSEAFSLKDGRISAALEKGTIVFNTVQGRLQSAQWQRKIEGAFTVKLKQKNWMWDLDHQHKVKVRVLNEKPKTS